MFTLAICACSAIGVVTGIVVGVATQNVGAGIITAYAMSFALIGICAAKIAKRNK